MQRMVFPCTNGIVVQTGNKKVISTTDCQGQKKLRSFICKNKVIFWNFPFVRGLQYFFCGIFAQFVAFLDVAELCDKQGKKPEDERKNFIKNLIALIFLFIGSAIFADVALGFLPSQLGLLIVDFRGSPFLRNLLILAFKLLFFTLFLLFFRTFPVFLEFLRFNRAADIASFGKNKDKKCPPKPTNFLNFLVFTFLLSQIVITLIAANFGVGFNLLFHISIFVLCICVAYEFLNLLEMGKGNFLKFLAFPTAIFVYANPSITHIETANIALLEASLLVGQKGREFMEENMHAFAVVYNEVKNKLSSAGVQDKSETDWLIATVLGKNRAEIKLVSSVSEKQYQEIQKAAMRRAKGESLDNIFGFTEFFGLRFDVNKKVLTPRMETEILVEQVLKSAKNFNQPKILDLGTGSGAIAVSVAKNCEDAIVTAVDISKQALAVAEVNAKKNDVKVEFLYSNCFENLKRKRKFDIIVSNPPYIPTDDIKKLDKNVRECDPLLALDGGPDGLEFYRHIIPATQKRLTNGGLLMFEVGKGQASAVRKILRECGFNEIRTIKDYNKIERIVCGKYK